MSLENKRIFLFILEIRSGTFKFDRVEKLALESIVSSEIARFCAVRQFEMVDSLIFILYFVIEFIEEEPKKYLRKQSIQYLANL